MICVDAGPVIHLVLFPEHVFVQELWTRWEESQQVITAPALLYYEVTNGLYRYQRQGLLSSHTVDIALRAALALPIQVVSDPDLHRQARAFASQYNLSAVYDAHYLALAERLGAELWTRDKRLFNALEPFDLKWLKLIKD
jgi:predicted nucleic acid-binding protein